uniref:Uncharacterized protein n=1 Tax=Cacopsylla melanoneura TaxID=428564 RepID=A0A8D8U7Y7_9HEMI
MSKGLTPALDRRERSQRELGGHFSRYTGYRNSQLSSIMIGFANPWYRVGLFNPIDGGFVRRLSNVIDETLAGCGSLLNDIPETKELFHVELGLGLHSGAFSQMISVGVAHS